MQIDRLEADLARLTEEMRQLKEVNNAQSLRLQDASALLEVSTP